MNSVQAYNLFTFPQRFTIGTIHVNNPYITQISHRIQKPSIRYLLNAPPLLPSSILIYVSGRFDPPMPDLCVLFIVRILALASIDRPFSLFLLSLFGPPATIHGQRATFRKLKSKRHSFWTAPTLAVAICQCMLRSVSFLLPVVLPILRSFCRIVHGTAERT